MLELPNTYLFKAKTYIRHCTNYSGDWQDCLPCCQEGAITTEYILDNIWWSHILLVEPEMKELLPFYCNTATSAHWKCYCLVYWPLHDEGQIHFNTWAVLQLWHSGKLYMSSQLRLESRWIIPCFLQDKVEYNLW